MSNIESGNVNQVMPEQMSRRSFIIGAATAAGAALLANACTRSSFESAQGSDTANNNEVMTEDYRMFEDDGAQKIADQLGLTAGNLWMTDAKSLDVIRESSAKNGYLTQQKLLPIFPAAIYEYQEVIEQVANEEDVPCNVAAVIASIESAGLLAADSGVANGLYQVVPGLHFDRIVAVAEAAGKPVPNADQLLAAWNQEKDRQQSTGRFDIHAYNKIVGHGAVEALQDPYIGCKVGLQILKGYYQEVVANSKNHGIKPNSPVLWARVLSAYNGGSKNGSQAYETMPTESQLYAVHAVRYFLIAEVAAQLRNQGYDNEHIARAIVSKETDARAYAYQTVKGGALRGNPKIGDYENLWKILSDSNLHSGDGVNAETARKAKDAYEHYKAGLDNFDLPVSPALRVWLVIGGLGLFRQVEANNNADNYKQPKLNS